MPLADAEPARALMLQAAPDGFEEREEPGGVELASYVAPEKRGALTAALQAWRPRVEPVAAGWETAWQRFHKPVAIGDLWLGPPWASPPAGLRAVTIRPGMAFGTGAHPTTRLCIELLLEEDRCPLLDLGCGSGVLSVAGAVLGFAPVEAVDVDPVAVEETRNNAASNGVNIDVRESDVQQLGSSSPPLVVANLPLQVLRTGLAAIRPGRAVISGFQADVVLELSGYCVLERREREGWGAALLASDTRTAND
ncbi:MAG: 50S ribosomal protein L11 methyltransferase [Gaiellaceae bacterium]